jgi:hypothetical protein
MVKDNPLGLESIKEDKIMMRNKLDSKGYGFLPECEIRSILFEEYTVDLIGPWNIFNFVENHASLKHLMYLSKIPSQESMSRSQAKIPTQKHNHICCLFVCLLV